MKSFKKISDFTLFFKLLKERDKHLVLVSVSELKKIEEKCLINLGSRKPNKIRPAIFWKFSASNDLYCVVFLTASKKTSIRVNLSLCKEKNKNCKDFIFYENSFVFQTPDNRYVCILLKTPSLISNFYHCSKCENLEILENLPCFDF